MLYGAMLPYRCVARSWVYCTVLITVCIRNWNDELLPVHAHNETSSFRFLPLIFLSVGDYVGSKPYAFCLVPPCVVFPRSVALESLLKSWLVTCLSVIKWNRSVTTKPVCNGGKMAYMTPYHELLYCCGLLCHYIYIEIRLVWRITV